MHQNRTASKQSTFLLLFLMMAVISSCIIEKNTNYTAKIGKGAIDKDSLIEVNYFNLTYSLGNQLNFFLDFTPAVNSKLLIKSITASAAQVNEQKETKQLSFDKLVGTTYYTYTHGYVYYTEKKYTKISSQSLNTYTCLDTLSNNNHTNRYGFTLSNQYNLDDKWIHFDVSIDFQNLVNNSSFVKNYIIKFKRKKFLSFSFPHDR